MLLVERDQRVLQLRKALQQLLFQSGAENRMVGNIDLDNALFFRTLQQSSDLDARDAELARNLLLRGFIL